jgi:hypothetical protein
MKERSVFLCLVLTAMLTAFGCGDSSDGNGGDGGNGNGGSGGDGSSTAACERICQGLDCTGMEPPANPSECKDACEAGEDVGLGFFFDEACEDETVAFLDCFESVDCDENAAQNQCQNEAADWGFCIQDNL